MKPLHKEILTPPATHSKEPFRPREMARRAAQKFEECLYITLTPQTNGGLLMEFWEAIPSHKRCAAFPATPQPLHYTPRPAKKRVKEDEVPVPIEEFTTL